MISGVELEPVLCSLPGVARLTLTKSDLTRFSFDIGLRREHWLWSPLLEGPGGPKGDRPKGGRKGKGRALCKLSPSA